MIARPRLLLFDMDGVLADYDRQARCVAMAAAAGAETAAMFEAMFGAQGVEHASDRGDIGLEGALARLRERHGWQLAAADFIAARRIATRARPRMLALCRALRAQARLAVFTNNGDWVQAHLRSIVPELPPLFGEAVVSSGAMRQSKPAPEAFLACLRQLQHPTPAEVLFIDDNADNVAGARQAGLDALRYTDYTALRGALRERGFELPGDDDAP